MGRRGRQWKTRFRPPPPPRERTSPAILGLLRAAELPGEALAIVIEARQATRGRYTCPHDRPPAKASRMVHRTQAQAKSEGALNLRRHLEELAAKGSSEARQP
jgi:hypothetical protein